MAKTGVSQIVVVGASAGGIDALGILVAGLDGTFPAPVVIAQHLDPRRPSHLQEILSRRTAMEVKSVTAEEKLQAGVVYVVPANRDVMITDHLVRVREEVSSRGPRPSVDRLMETAAASFGEHLIAVILSGEGSDGAEGARAVKLAGVPSSSRIRSRPRIHRCRSHWLPRRSTSSRRWRPSLRSFVT